jgi:hypothetical protein
MVSGVKILPLFSTGGKWTIPIRAHAINQSMMENEMRKFPADEVWREFLLNNME